MLLESADEVVSYLHTQGANIHVSDVAGNTPLHIAAAASSLASVASMGTPSGGVRRTSPCVLYLLQNGADVTVTNRVGMTALHVAAGNGCLDAVRLLVQFGAPLTQRDASGALASDLALKHGHSEVVDFLQQLIATQEPSSEQDSLSLSLHGGAGVPAEGPSNVEKRIASAARSVLHTGAQGTGSGAHSHSASFASKDVLFPRSRVGDLSGTLSAGNSPQHTFPHRDVHSLDLSVPSPMRPLVASSSAVDDLQAGAASSSVNPSLSRSDVDGLLMQVKSLLQQNRELELSLVDARGEVADARAAQEAQAATLSQRNEVCVFICGFICVR
jgi:hypothetical protein